MRRSRCYTMWWAYSPDPCPNHASMQAKIECLHPHLTSHPRPLASHPERADEVVHIAPALAERELSRYKLSTRLRTTLVLNNYWRLGDLDGVAYADLMQLRYCGKKTVAELKRLVKRFPAPADWLSRQATAPAPAFTAGG